MDAFDEHVDQLSGFANSSTEDQDQQNWNDRIQNIVDYYINKTSELLDIYDSLNKTIDDIKTNYCTPKPTPTTPNTPYFHHV